MGVLRLSGAIAALVTPYDASGRVEAGALRALVDFHIDQGLAGFLVAGSTGEGLLLSLEERRRLTAEAVRAAGGRALVIAHVGTPATGDALRLAQEAADAGADAVAAIPPIYYPNDTKAIVAFYRALAEAVSLPVYAYHIPSATGVWLYRDVVRELVTIPGCAGLKFTDTNLDELHYLKTAVTPTPNIVYGSDETLAAGLFMGADGGVGSTYNAMPGVYTAICGAAAEDRWPDARDLQRRATRVINVLKRYQVVPALKAILARAGYPCGTCRAPIEPLRGTPERLFADVLAAGYAELPGVAAIDR